MRDAERQTRSRLMELFDEHGFHPNTRLGQNFLIDLNIIDFIVDQANLQPHDLVLEIGAGTGGMTAFLAQAAGQVIAVELDEKMHGLASAVTAGYDNVTLLNTDALKNKNHFAPEVLNQIEQKLAMEEIRGLKLISNLPYSIATPVVSNLVATDLPWERMVITIQLELGQRMVSKPSRSHYGSLSVWLQSQCRVKLLKRLPPTVFWPRPKVNSAVVQLMPDDYGRAAISDRSFFQDFVRRLFHQRRKFLRSVLVGMYRKQLEKTEVDQILTEMNFSEQARAEEEPPARLVELANRLHARIEFGERGALAP
jgi:16S rRNA (adenine1518-N6/adenine1519-N6)-dimethyltransferase